MVRRDNRVTSITNVPSTQTYTYAGYSRVTEQVTKHGESTLITTSYTYRNPTDTSTTGQISKLTLDASGFDVEYSYTYDDNGNILSVSDGTNITSYVYDSAGQLVRENNEAADKTLVWTYDNAGNILTRAEYAYTGEGNLYSVTALEDGVETKYIYNYDSLGRLVYSERRDGDESVMRARQGYDNVNRLVYQAWQLGDVTYTEGYTYNSSQDGSLNTFKTATGETLTMGYDGLQRLISVTGGVYGKTYTYRDINYYMTTTQVASLVYDLPTDLTYSYTYDNMGNIATYTDANGTMTYTYDAQGQLLSATDGTTTYSYTYDTVGNILTGNGHTYTYGDTDWKDLLTAVDGESITYDAIGNPTSYYNGTRWTFTWEDGKELAAATDGTTNLSYEYDSGGLRTSKTADGVQHTYYYAGGRLLRETYGDTVLDFFYDASGNAYALKYNGTVYYYITNLQGDVTSIVDGTGAVVAAYEYDPYGNVLTATGDLAEVNPLRYRGYVYDTETGLYYLESRYYDPELGRFINADTFASTGQGILGNNMFAYCGNDPVNMSDPYGYIPRAPGIILPLIPDEDSDSDEPNNDVVIVDLTEKLTTYMQSNADALKVYYEEHGFFAAALYFYKNVTDGGALDIKLQDEWAFEEGTVYLFNGKELRYDDPGNINFGYVGAVIFTEDILCLGAGLNQIKKWGFKYGDLSTFYDDPRDNEMIKYGYDLYWEEY